jgi:nucleotide-binding universal stress UspA family protein
MNDSPAAPVVVGVDGSTAAFHAVDWAVREAKDRMTSMRLVYVIDDEETTGRCEWALECARSALDRAAGIVADVAPALVVATAIERGKADQVLLDASRDAAMICIGVDGRRTGPLGTLAATLAKDAHCPVAIIRDTHAPERPQEGGVVAVVLDDDADNDAVVHQAMKEGRLRHAVVRQIDRRRDSWVRRFPEVRVETVAAGTGWCFNGHDRELPDLAVVGRTDGARIGGIETPNCHPIVGYPDCSILVVRD